MNTRPLLLTLLAVGCKSAEQKQAEAAVRQLQEAGRQLGAAVGAAAGAAAGAATGTVAGLAKASEPVDFRELRALLPEKAAGLDRTSAEGEKAGVMGFVVSNAEGRYEGEGGKSLTIKITDIGAAAGVAALAAFGWAMAEVDKETDSGYERTITIKGNRGYEKYDRNSRWGEVSMIVASRFVVEVNGNELDMDDLRNALDQVDVGRLEQMRNVGVR